MIAGLVVVAAVGAFALAPPWPVAAESPTALRADAAMSDLIDNIVVIVEQDHTYDSYFAGYTSPAATATTTPTTTQSTTSPVANPGLIGLADNYTLFDNYFASSSGGTLGNMLELMTGNDNGLLHSSKESLAALREMTAPTVFDQLSAASVSWNLYVGGLDNVDPAKVVDGSYLDADVLVPASLYRAPVLGMQRTWGDPSIAQHIVDQDSFFSDTAAGALPAVSVVIPSPSDHPGQSDDGGEDRLLSLVNAVQKSAQWGHTAIFVTWDDGGGQYDSVVPPIGDGLRVPLLLVSPYARAGYISHDQRDHLSLLELIEARFGLPALNDRVDASPSFDDGFDFTAPARTPLIVSRSVLPSTPVGTSQQNQRTVLLYLAGLGAAVIVAGAGMFRLRTRTF